MTATPPASAQVWPTDEEHVHVLAEAKRLCREYRQSLPAHVSTEAAPDDFLGQAIINLGLTPLGHCNDHPVAATWCVPCANVQNGQAHLNPTTDTSPAHPTTAYPDSDFFARFANCTNYLENEDRPCTGTLRFRLGDPQAACNYCAAWCGWLVADYRPYNHGTST